MKKIGQGISTMFDPKKFLVGTVIACQHCSQRFEIQLEDLKKISVSLRDRANQFYDIKVECGECHVEIVAPRTEKEIREGHRQVASA